jgi:secreted PhoX family phosphatase
VGCSARARPLRPTSALSFKPIQGTQADDVVLPPGYRYDLLVRWGESLWTSTPDLDASRLADGVLLEPGAAERQQRQFGTNCDAIHFFPLDARGERGILCVNNEYTVDELMFPQHLGIAGALLGRGREFVSKHPQAVDVAKAAQGVSVIEIARVGGRWQLVKDSRYNRRITAQTPIDIGGPARGAALLRTQADPDGVRALGTFGNCAGGETPWGTYLTAEENIQDYFGNLDQLKTRSDVDPYIVESHRRWRMWKVNSLYAWEAADARFDLPRTPTEPVPLRLDRRDRSARSDAPACETHGARALRARRSEVRSSRTTAAWPCTWATTTSSNTSTSSFPMLVSIRRTRPRTATCSIAAPCTPRGWMRAAAANGCRWCSIRKVR